MRVDLSYGWGNVQPADEPMTSPSESSFAQGQAAFAAGDYATAIAILQPIAETDLDPATRTQAYQTLILAYHRGDRARDALDLCKRLSQDPETHPWAPKALQDLTQRYRKANAAAFTPPHQQREAQAAEGFTSNTPEKRPLPVVTPEEPEVAPALFVSGREWRNAERAKQWKPLRQPRRWKFWLRMGATIAILFWVMQGGWAITTAVLKWLWFNLPGLTPLNWWSATATRPIAALLIISVVASPWLLDAILKWQHQRQELPLYTLASQHPETAKVLQRLARQHNVPTPKLGLISLGTPWIVTYGNWSRTARMVMSDALLEQLEDEELATVVASQFAAIVQRDMIVMSGAIALLQLPFLGYQLLAETGNKLRSTPIPSWAQPALQMVLGLVAASFYGVYWLWRLPLLYFSRQRMYYGDRFGVEFTGNPNALSRALLKMAIGISHHISQRQQTLPLLESWDLLMPLSHRQAVSFGGLPEKTPFSDVLTWDCTNPYRQWLALVNSHPLVGDRLYLLNRYANHWQLQPEVDLPTLIPPPKTWRDHLQKFQRSYKALPILQSAVLASLVFGVAARALLWGVGTVADLLSTRISLWRLIWLANANPFLDACIAIAFSLSLIIWINGYFPDIRIAPSRQDPRIEDLLRNPKQVPPKSYPVRLEGQLLGRPGVFNWLGQDLILKTSSGLIKLHFFSKLGPLGNLFPWPRRPITLVGQDITVFGWFRRGSTPWVDVDVMRTQTAGIKTRSGYPVWVTILAIAAALWGAYHLLQA